MNQYKVIRSQKLIPFLQEKIGENYSGKVLRKALEANCCKINGKIERFGSAKVEKGDLVELCSDWNKKVSSEKKSFSKEILFEDDETFWINKPKGFLCDPKECERHFGKNLQLIHRLDKETTGVLGFAKKEEVFQKWKTLFQERKVEKSYLAVVDGIFSEKKRTVHTFLGKKGHFQGQTIWGSCSLGQEAITHFEVLLEGKNSSLVLCRPVTGRTHQIRVHLKEIGHPILIDRQYSSFFVSKYPASRILLHALELKTSFLSIKAPLTQDFNEAIDWMKSTS